MEYLPHPFEEQQPNDNALYEQITNGEDWGNFCKAVEGVEAKANTIDVEADDNIKKIHQYEGFLNELFGEEYSGGKSKLLGIGEIADISGYRTGEDKTIYPSDAIRFNRIALNDIDDCWQVQLEFTHPESPDGINQCYYLVAPRNIMQLEIAAETSNDSLEDIEDSGMILATRIGEARRLTSSHDFLSASTDEQHQWLDSVSLNMDADIAALYDEYDTEIACTRYYAVFDDMNDLHIPFEDCYTDQSTLDPAQQFKVIGKLERFMYAEQVSHPDKHFDSPSDFFVGHGVPCLVVYSEQQKCRYFILPDSIQALSIVE